MAVPTDSLAKKLGVNVFQVPQDITPAPLDLLQSTCVVGLSSFVESQLDTEKSFLGRHTSVSYKTSANVTNNVLPNSAVVDLTSVEVFISAASGIVQLAEAAQVAPATAGVSASNVISGVSVEGLVDLSGSDGVTAGTAVFTSATGGFTADMVGKYITFEVAAVPTSFEITAYTDTNTIEVDGTPAADTGIAFVVSAVALEQKLFLVDDLVNEWVISNITATEITVVGDVGVPDVPDGAVSFEIYNGGGFVAYTNVVRIVTMDDIAERGPILLSYVAERHDLDDTQIAVSSVSDLEDIFGESALVPENPLGYGLLKAIEASGSLFTIYGISVAADDAVSHTEAVELLEVKRNFYFVVPLSFKEEIGQLYNAFEKAINVPEQRYACVVIWTPKKIYKNRLASQSLTGVSGASGTTLTDSEVDFVAIGVQPGHYINTFTGDDSDVESGVSHPILSVSTHVLTVDTGEGVAMAFGDGDPVTYEIIEDWFPGPSSTEKNKQAEALFNYGRSKEDERFWINWPDYWVDGDVTVPGYFANCAYAGAVMSVAEQQPLGNFPISGFSALSNSSDYFKQGYGRHIHQIESGGIAVATQPVDGALIRFEEQWTSNMTAVTYQYRNVIRNRDSVKMVFINSLCPMMGRDNLTPKFIDKFNRAAAAIIARLQDSGQLGRNALIQKVASDPNDPTRLNMWLNMDWPYPAHDANIYFYI